jgi:uncharacterized membrane protein
MANLNQLEWLKEQLVIWVDEELITTDQAQKIRAQYPKKSGEPNYNLAYIILGSVAALLVGGGMILVFAYQWEHISDFAKALLSVVPVLLGLLIFIYAFVRKREEPAWRESASGFMMLMIAATIGLYSQTFEVFEQPEQFWIYWILIAAPLMYLLNSTMASMLFCFGLTVWTVEVEPEQAQYFWLILLLFIPHLWLNLHKTDALIRQNLLEWTFALTFTFGWFATMNAFPDGVNFLGTALWLCVFYLLGQRTALRDIVFLRPLQLYAIGGSFILLLTISFDLDLQAIRLQDWSLEPAGAKVNLIILLLLITTWIWYWWRFIRSEEKDDLQGLFLTLPLLVFAYLQVYFFSSSVAPILFGSLIGLAVSAVYLKKGITQDALFYINIGMLLILSLASIRFFNAEWSMFWKGIVFILLGLVFLGVNVYLARREKARRMLET